MKIAIIGAGIGGLTTAITLKKYRPDLEIDVYESSPALEAVGAGLMLAANAVLAFEQLDMKDKVLAVGHIIEKFQILDKKGRLITETDNIAVNRTFHTINNFSVHRADLQRILLNEIEDTRLHLNKKVDTFASDHTKVNVRFQDETSVEADFVVATDGIHSVFRRNLLPDVPLRFAGYTCWRGITHRLPSNFDVLVASETWGEGKRFGIVPLADGRIYWFACLNASQAKDEQFARFTQEQLMQSFEHFHAPISEILTLTDPKDILWNDIIDFKPLDRFAFDSVLLLGDAAHTTTPNMGQGACQAIEGAVILGKTLQQTSDIAMGFKAFEEKRIQRTKFIVDRSYQIGKIAQLSNPLLTRARDFAFRLIPAKANERQIKKILDVRFDL